MQYFTCTEGKNNEIFGFVYDDYNTRENRCCNEDAFTMMDIEKVREAEDVFKECMKDYFLPPEKTNDAYVCRGQRSAPA